MDLSNRYSVKKMYCTVIDFNGWPQCISSITMMIDLVRDCAIIISVEDPIKKNDFAQWFPRPQLEYMVSRKILFESIGDILNEKPCPCGSYDCKLNNMLYEKVNEYLKSHNKDGSRI